MDVSALKAELRWAAPDIPGEDSDFLSCFVYLETDWIRCSVVVNLEK